jgi:protein subunit release factor A|tara:strand:+ start:1979 stop:2431 length:453 start_codon:yes stop_codon:yes gene_type:complete
MPQIRKFEQDAIVDSTLATIIADKEEVIATLKATPEYQGIAQQLSAVNDLVKQRKDIDAKVTTLKTELTEAVVVFNKDVLNSNPIYELEFDRYSYRDPEGLQFNTSCSKYNKAGVAIQNEVAIALLPKDAVNDINSIIESIASKFRVVIA